MTEDPEELVETEADLPLEEVAGPDHALASRIGKAVEHLIAASCILASGGELNVSTAMVDDEGVDLVFHRRGAPETLAVQVKSRTTDAKTIGEKGRFLASVRSQTFSPRADLYVLFVVVNVPDATYGPAWFVPSVDLDAIASTDGKGRRRFSASVSDTSNDQWSQYRVERVDLPARILGVLAGLRR